MATVVASSSPTAFVAISEREGCPGAVDLSNSSSRRSFGIEAVSGSSSLGRPNTGRVVRFSGLNCENSSSSYFGLRTTSKDSGRAEYATLSSKLTNDVNQSASSMVPFSRRPEEFYSTMVTDVIEDTEFGNLTVSEGRHEVRRSDASRISRVTSPQLDVGGSTKLMSFKNYLEEALVFIKQTERGPPRWFCPIEATGSPADAPILLFLPGLDFSQFLLLYS